MTDASLSAWVIEAGDQDFEQEVLQRSNDVPVVVDFWAPSCQPCLLLGPKLAELAREAKGAFVVAKVNVESAQELANYFQIESIPTVYVIRGGQLYPGFQGLLPDGELRDFINGILPSETDKIVKEAQGLEAGDPAQAEKSYRSVLAELPEHELARLGLARLLVQRHERDEATKLLAPFGVVGDVGIEAERLRRIIEVEAGPPVAGDEKSLRKKMAEDPENAQTRYELGSVLAALGRYPEALEMLLSSAERDKKLAQNQVRELMVKIFQIIGLRSEIADDYRGRLQSLLY
jgi:putative thioredoxin